MFVLGVLVVLVGGDKKAIWPVKILHRPSINILLWKTREGPSLACNNRSVKQKTKVDGYLFSAVNFIVCGW